MQSIPDEIIAYGRAGNQEEIPREPIEAAEEMEMVESIAPETGAVENIRKSIDTPRHVADERGILSQDVADEGTKIYVPCPRKGTGSELPGFVPCKRGIICDPNGFSCARCNVILTDRTCKDNGVRRKGDYCARCRSSMARCCCAPTQSLKCRPPTTDPPRFRSLSSSRNGRMPDCCGLKAECARRKTAVTCRLCCRPHGECKCGRCATLASRPRTNECGYKISFFS